MSEEKFYPTDQPAFYGTLENQSTNFDITQVPTSPVDWRSRLFVGGPADHRSFVQLDAVGSAHGYMSWGVTARGDFSGIGVAVACGRLGETGDGMLEVYITTDANNDPAQRQIGARVSAAYELNGNRDWATLWFEEPFAFKEPRPNINYVTLVSGYRSPGGTFGSVYLFGPVRLLAR